MIKKIMILGLILLGAYFFYKKFMEDTLEPFFRRHRGNVDFFQQKVQKVPDYKVNEK